MVDAVTNNYGLTLPTVGGDVGTWGGVLNSGTFTPVDAVLGNTLPVTIAGVDVTLTTTQFQNAVFTLSGTLTGNRNLILPLSPNSSTAAVGGKFIVVNNCTGSFNVTTKTAASGSTGAVCPNGAAVALYSDGTNVKYDNTGLPASAPATNGNPNGQIAGAAGSVNTNASLAADYTNGALYLCTQSGTAGSATWVNVAGNPSFNTAFNLQLNATVGVNILTVSVKAANTGSDPVVGNPVIVQFRDSNQFAGDLATVSITSALSIAVPVGATLGSLNGVPFRFWVVAFNNAGTVVLGLINCSTANQIFPLYEGFVQGSTAISAGALSAGVFYTQSVSLVNKAFRIVGYLEYSTGLVTAGTYNNAPTTVQLFGPGVQKPGEAVQTQQSYTTAMATGTNAFGISNSIPTNTAGTQFMAQAITPMSTCNLLKVEHLGYYADDGGGVNAGLGLYQDSISTAVASVLWGSPLSNSAGNSDLSVALPLTWYQTAGTTASTTFKVRVGDAAGHQITFNGANASPFFGGTIASHMRITELMG